MNHTAAGIHQPHKKGQAMPKQKKPYTLFLSFETFEKLWNFYLKHLPEDTELFHGCAVDHEFRGIGRAPKNSIIVRQKGSDRTIGGPITPEIVEAGSK